jgi:hypothetical protein
MAIQPASRAFWAIIAPVLAIIGAMVTFIVAAVTVVVASVAVIVAPFFATIVMTVLGDQSEQLAWLPHRQHSRLLLVSARRWS